jgi:hypothetical protein
MLALSKRRNRRYTHVLVEEFEESFHELLKPFCALMNIHLKSVLLTTIYRNTLAVIDFDLVELGNVARREFFRQ